MIMKTTHPVISAFQTAARQVPAYKRILEEAGIDPDQVRNLEDFRNRVPVVDKKMTFGRFPVVQLCREGKMVHPAGLLTSSGHSGLFAFGIYHAASSADETERVDDALDMLLQVRRKTTLLINCLPMGVQVPTRACSLAQTSVRPDMVTALVGRFGSHYEQVILVGETAFIKHVLELGQTQGIDWHSLLVHVIVGEEPLAENARKYLETLLGCDINRPETGLIASSMGIAEVGLYLFFELPPLITLRRALLEDPRQRQVVFGNSGDILPMLFTYDPSRIFIEVLEDRNLVITTLDPKRALPLIRYRSGDVAAIMDGDRLARVIDAPDGNNTLGQLPVVALAGRGEAAWAGDIAVYPEQVKEGIYHDPLLARLTTANFRLRSGTQKALLRIQLAPGVAAEPNLPDRFAQALLSYVRAPLEVKCEPYETFSAGMTLDYERKFPYLEN